MVVLEEHGDSVTLLAGFEVLAFVHVEEGHLLEQLAFALLNHTLDLFVGHGRIHEQCQVAAHWQSLWQVVVFHILLGCEFAEQVPVKLCEVHFLIHIEFLSHVGIHHAKHTDEFAATVLVREGRGKQVVVELLNHHFLFVDAKAAEDVLNSGLQVVNAEWAHCVGPTVVVVVTSEPNAECLMLGVWCESHLGVVGFGIVAIHIAEFIHFEVGVFAVDVTCEAFQTAEQHGLAHHVEVAAEGVHQVHAVLFRVTFQAFVVT